MTNEYYYILFSIISIENILTKRKEKVLIAQEENRVNRSYSNHC